MLTFKPRVIWEGAKDTLKVRTGLGKSDRPGSQGGSGKRGLLRKVRAPSFYPDRRGFGTTGGGGSVSARSHTLHCYSLVAKAKTQNLWVVLHVNRCVS